MLNLKYKADKVNQSKLVYSKVFVYIVSVQLQNINTNKERKEGCQYRENIDIVINVEENTLILIKYDDKAETQKTNKMWRFAIEEDSVYKKRISLLSKKSNIIPVNFRLYRELLYIVVLGLYRICIAFCFHAHMLLNKMTTQSTLTTVHSLYTK